jgi:ABC-type transporter Mla subunit MlaD
MADAIVALTALSDRTERTVREVTAGHAALREALIGLTGIVGRMSDRVDTLGERVDERLDRLAAAQERTDQQIKELGKYVPRQPHKGRRRTP